MNLEDLQARRTSYVAGMRELIDELERTLPDVELRGIATRVGAVLQAQLPALEAFAALDLSEQSDFDAVFQTLVRAQHLPRMIVAFSKVLEEDGHRDWVSARRRAVELAQDLALILQSWVLLHAIEFEEGDPEDPA